jgi:hypothetical protein
MNFLYNKPNLFFLLIAFSLSSLFIVILLLPNNLWYKIFIFLNIPAGGLDLADAKSLVNYSQIYVEKGFVEVNSVDFWNRKFTGISIIWKEIAVFFKFYKPINFYIFIFVSFFIYIFSFLKIAFINNKRLNFLVIIFFFFSTSSFYLIERGNFDLILFGLVTLLCFLKKKKYQLAIIFLLSFLKINLIYLFFILVRNFKTFVYYFLLATIILFVNYKYIIAGYVEIGNSASITHYGLFTIIKSALYFLYKINAFDVNKYTNIVGVSLLIFIFTIVSYFIIKEFKKIKIKNLNLEFTLIERLFLTGSLFYIFSFISFSAPDYKLVFLVLALPYLLEKKCFLEIFLIFLIMNSCFFETYPLFQNIFNGEVRIYTDKYNTKYLFLGLIVHSLKILIFVLISKETINLYKEKINKV